MIHIPFPYSIIAQYTPLSINFIDILSLPSFQVSIKSFGFPPEFKSYVRRPWFLEQRDTTFSDLVHAKSDDLYLWPVPWYHLEHKDETIAAYAFPTDSEHLDVGFEHSRSLQLSTCRYRTWREHSHFLPYHPSTWFTSKGTSATVTATASTLASIFWDLTRQYPVQRPHTLLHLQISDSHV